MLYKIFYNSYGILYRNKIYGRRNFFLYSDTLKPVTWRNWEDRYCKLL